MTVEPSEALGCVQLVLSPGSADQAAAVGARSAHVAPVSKTRPGLPPGGVSAPVAQKRQFEAPPFSDPTPAANSRAGVVGGLGDAL